MDLLLNSHICVKRNACILDILSYHIDAHTYVAYIYTDLLYDEKLGVTHE